MDSITTPLTIETMATENSELMAEPTAAAKMLVIDMLAGPTIASAPRPESVLPAVACLHAALGNAITELRTRIVDANPDVVNWTLEDAV